MTLMSDKLPSVLNGHALSQDELSEITSKITSLEKLFSNLSGGMKTSADELKASSRALLEGIAQLNEYRVGARKSNIDFATFEQKFKDDISNFQVDVSVLFDEARTLAGAAAKARFDDLVAEVAKANSGVFAALESSSLATQEEEKVVEDKASDSSVVEPDAPMLLTIASECEFLMTLMSSKIPQIFIGPKLTRNEVSDLNQGILSFERFYQQLSGELQTSVEKFAAAAKQFVQTLTEMNTHTGRPSRISMLALASFQPRMDRTIGTLKIHCSSLMTSLREHAGKESEVSLDAIEAGISRANDRLDPSSEPVLLRLSLSDQAPGSANTFTTQ